MPCSRSISCSALTSFSSRSAASSLACVGRAAAHAWNSSRSSSSIAFNSKPRDVLNQHICIEIVKLNVCVLSMNSASRLASSSYGETILVWWSNARNLCARISVTGREGVSECLMGFAFEGEGESIAQEGKRDRQRWW